VKFNFIKRHRSEFRINLMCSILGVSRPGFYAWLHRKPSARTVRHRELIARIQSVHVKSKNSYGAPRIYRQLRREGVQCGKHQVANLMRSRGIRGRFKRKFRITTVTNDDHRKATNVLNRQFHPTARDRAWCGDITYLWTLEGWLYLAVILDLYSRRVVGWSMSKDIDEQLALDALDMAVRERNPAPGLIHHSDRGCQYTANEYTRRLATRGFVQSMSRRGNCWDNAVAESFFHSLKTELVADCRFETRAQATAEVADYITGFYNSWRLHSTIGFTTPIEYEMGVSL
jgi:putative transposase